MRVFFYMNYSYKIGFYNNSIYLLIKLIMEIKEIISYYLNKDTNIIDVSFRTIDDDEDVLRNDTINYDIVEEYGFDLVTESFDFFGDDDDLEEDFFEQEKIELDYDELLIFLNEYYMVNPKLLPKSEFY